MLSRPAFGPASITQAKAPRKGGVTNDARTRPRITALAGKSVRAVSQAMGATIASEATPTQTAITTFAPHPNAARLFTDFSFGREVQQALADSEGLYTGHPEVKYPADKPKLSDLKLLQVDAEELEKRNEEIKKRFVEFFGA